MQHPPRGFNHFHELVENAAKQGWLRVVKGLIAANFDLTQQAVSQHLTVLKRAGLLAERRDGTRRLYSLRSESLEPLRVLLDEFWPDALTRLKQSVERDHPRTPRRRTT